MSATAEYDIELMKNTLRRLAQNAVNCCSIGEISVMKGEAGDQLMIEIVDYHFGNFIDCRRQMTLLIELQKLGLVPMSTRTMWLGFFGKRFYMWCSL